jgi:hypothetical protein
MIATNSRCYRQHPAGYSVYYRAVTIEGRLKNAVSGRALTNEILPQSEAGFLDKIDRAIYPINASSTRLLGHDYIFIF